MSYGVNDLLRPLFGRRARLRWIHLILGGALAMPYVFVGQLVVGPAMDSRYVFNDLPLQLLSFAVGLPLAAVSAAVFPLTRPLESGAVRSLCGIGADRLAHGPARTWAAKGVRRPGSRCISGSAGSSRGCRWRCRRSPGS